MIQPNSAGVELLSSRSWRLEGIGGGSGFRGCPIVTHSCDNLSGYSNKLLQGAPH